MRFGLIGCGWIVERDHVPAMLRSDKVQIVATADVSAQRSLLVGGNAGLAPESCYVDYRDLLSREDIDVVSVASLEFRSFATPLLLASTSSARSPSH